MTQSSQLPQRSSRHPGKKYKDLVKDLRDEVKKLMGYGEPHRVHFVPKTELRELLAKQAEPVLEKIIKNCKSTEKREPGFPNPTDLKSFIIDKASKIFGILLVQEEHSRIITFYMNNFGDTMLPVSAKPVPDPDDDDDDDDDDEDDGCRTIELSPQTDPGDIVAGLKLRWREVDANGFLKTQWQFLAHIFKRDKFRHEITEKNYLPLMRKLSRDDNSGRNYSWVEEWSIHKDYIEFMEPKDLCFDSQGNPRVAIKQLKPTANNMTGVAEREAKGLELMRDADDEHLMKAAAYFWRDPNHYFIFPWAEQGNLWEFWAKTESGPILNGHLTWVFTQVAGLARGIQKLHHPQSSQTRSANAESGSEETSSDSPSSETNNCRHGDLKPENILCFKARAEELSEGTEAPNIRLVITDVGLAQMHNKSTQMRPYTSTNVSTVRYLAPEMDTNPNGLLGRRFDIWAMGCVFLEFVLWLLYGIKELDLCTARIEEFFEPDETEIKTGLQPPDQTNTKKKRARRHRQVDKWIHHVKQDWRCSEGTALGKLIELIDKWMLVVNVEEMDASPTLQRQSTGVKESGAAKRADFSRKLGYRSYAPAVVKDLDGILTGLQQGEINAIGTKPPGGPDTPIGPLTKEGWAPSKLGKSNEYRFTPLSDNWDYTPDSTFAERVFAGLDWKSYVPHEAKSQLCKRCADLPLWSTGCHFYDSPSKLDFKADKEGCLLCPLLSRRLKQRKIEKDKTVHFNRIGSYLIVDDGIAQPVANLYKTPLFHPDTNETSLRSVPIGFLQLPRAGSVTHFKVLNDWLHHCDKEHSCFPVDVNFTPTRLIDVEESGSDTVRLLDHGRTHSARQEEKYIALSHRWGSPPQHVKFCTYKSNIDDFARGIKISQLPQTFQDAVIVTRGLGLRRLWIDSICIVQDDPDDWDTESKFMERVFSSAYCTIAASCASGSSDGFLKPRPERGCVAMQVPGSEDATYYVCDTIDDFHGHVDRSELNQRGWVLQERALSRRTIFFTEIQAYWECGGGVRCETMTTMKNRKASFLGDADFPRSADKYVKGMKIELFQDLYQRYSGLALSFSIDRPIAIKGLEIRLKDTFGTTGAYGVFDIYLHRCLLWRRAGDKLSRIPSSRGSPLPSWSWMAYDGPIRYEHVAFDTAVWNNEVSRVLVPNVPASRSTQIRSIQSDDDSAALDLAAPVWDVRDAARGTMSFDQGDQLTPLSLQCVIIGSSKTRRVGQSQTHWVLLVQKTIGCNEPIYERIGIGILQGSQVDFSGQKRIIRIK